MTWLFYCSGAPQWFAAARSLLGKGIVVDEEDDDDCEKSDETKRPP